ncbi:hypothetical protein B0H11DRAFT_2108338, partial [Mycena galericulata]
MKSLGSVSRRLKRCVLSSGRIRQESPVLPVEIWVSILRGLPDEDLLRAATVCRAFNTFCIATCLARHSSKLPHEQVIPGHAHLYTFALRALRLSCVQQPIQRLYLQFPTSDIFRHIASLADFVHKCSALREIIMYFPADVFDAPRFNSLISRTPCSRRDVLRAFSAAMSAMALKTPGPVVVISHSSSFTCRAEDISGWRMDASQFNTGTGIRAAFARMRRTLRISPFYGFTTVRLHNGEKRSVWPLTMMHDAAV